MAQVMTSSSAPNRPTRMVLPVEDWPAKDRALWLAGIAPLDLLRKSGEFFYLKEDVYDQAEAANEGI
jgi:hypothetical protein